MHGIKMDLILVPTDFSRHSWKAFRYAAALARLFRSRVLILHVLDTRMVDNVYHIHQFSPERAREEMRAAAERSVAAWRSMPECEGLETEPVYSEGIPSVEVKRVAEERGVDLIVMGTHGATGLTRLLYGSTAQGVVGSSPCPVLSVDPAGDGDPVVPEKD